MIKHSKKIRLESRNKLWSIYISYPLVRKFVYRNSFETFCNVYLMM